MSQLIQYPDGIYAVDAKYVRPGMAAIHLVIEQGRVALVDAGCSHSVPEVELALKALGLTADAVDYIILTHVHLDHAGGAGSMMKAFPNAQLVVHPRGKRHMVNPSMLIQGACAVYGAETVKSLYGEIVPIDSARIIEGTHELSIDLAGRELICLDTPGHAKHHICIVDTKANAIFTGDTFGLSLKELDVDGRQFMYPTTTPVQFEPEAMHHSIRLLLSYRPRFMYLTHFGQVNDVPARAQQLTELLDAQVAIAEQYAAPGADRHGKIKNALAKQLVCAVRQFGSNVSEAEVLALFESDLELNAQGLEIWLDHRERLAKIA